MLVGEGRCWYLSYSGNEDPRPYQENKNARKHDHILHVHKSSEDFLRIGQSKNENTCTVVSLSFFFFFGGGGGADGLKSCKIYGTPQFSIYERS